MFSALVILGTAENAPLVRSMVAMTGQIMVMREAPAPPGNYELGRLMNALVPDIVFIDLSSGEAALECVARIREFSPRAAIVGIGCTPEMKLLAKQVGLTAGVPIEATPEDLNAAIRRALELHQGGVERFLFTFLPSKAGSGCSTVVLNTAVAMARLGKRVLVIDADLRSGILALMLGVEPSGGTQAALSASDQLDTFAWRRNIVTLHGVDFLLSTRALDITPPDWANYYQVLNFAKPQYDAILVDMPELVNPATMEVVRRAQRLLPVCTPEIPSLRLTIHRCKELGRLKIADERIGILLNRYHRTDPPVNQLAELLGKPVAMTFPNDYHSVHAAMVAGRPVPAESPLGQAFESFAASLVEVTVTQREPTFKDKLRGLLRFASA